MKLKLVSGEEFELNPGENLYSSLKKHEQYITASCGGKGTCGKCKVRILAGDFEVRSSGKLTASERESGIVLACQTVPKSDLVIEIPKESKLVIGDKIAVSRTRNLAEYLKSFQVLISPIVEKISLELNPPSIQDNTSDLERLRRALSEKGLADIRFSHAVVEMMSSLFRKAGWKINLSYLHCNGTQGEAVFLHSPGECGGRYGIAIDIGTTTVVIYLVNLETGDIVDVGSTYNSQMRYGDDVITRIVYATEVGGLKDLQDSVVTDINTIVDSLSERHHIQTCEIESAVVAGNTTMSHMFWGLDTSTIREEPYIPAVNYFPLWRSGTARLSINPQAPVYTVPCIASYVGGDIIAGVLASKMHRNPEIALFMDIGTNGEIAVGNNEWLMAAACSAGPCFEGSGIRCGMRATAGAIEAVKIEPVTFEPQVSVIGGGLPLGICGSGMIDAVSEMFLTGVLDLKGKFIFGRTDRIRTGEDGPEFVFYKGDTIHKDIVLTEVDIENLLRAKAAVYAGISTLLGEIGFTLDAIDKIYIAGGFGNYINVERAITLGMLPDLPREKFVFLGNTSITGAYLCLLSGELRREAEEIASKMTYIELSVSGRFMDEYMSALFLPHTNISYFPSVQKLMEKK